jgi:hypothetical protein
MRPDVNGVLRLSRPVAPGRADAIYSRVLTGTGRIYLGNKPSS